MDPMLIWAVLLMTLAMAFFFAELLVPSGGLLGMGAVACVIAGIVMLFKIDTTAGLAGTTLTVLILPFLIVFALKIMPRTPIARKLALTHSQRRLTDPERGEGRSVPGEKELVGSFGEVLSDLRPVGTCLIHGHRHDCIAATGVITAGCRVRVISVDGIQIKVVKENE